MRIAADRRPPPPITDRRRRKLCGIDAISVTIRQNSHSKSERVRITGGIVTLVVTIPQNFPDGT
jgi:hypothetical protein